MFQVIWALISQCMGCFYFGTCTTLLPSAEKHLTSNHSHFYPQFQSRLVIRNYHGWNLIFCSAYKSFLLLQSPSLTSRLCIATGSWLFLRQPINSLIRL